MTIEYKDSKRIVTTSKSATGGTITTNGTKKVHTFTSSGTFTPSAGFDVEYLVIAGGGGGGGGLGGGGGSGGYRTATGFGVTGQAYTITVGAGGNAGASTNGSGTAGGDSTFSTITSTGGGFGGGQTLVGSIGGSGGASGITGGTGNAGTVGQGYASGNNGVGLNSRAGGGGAGSTGTGNTNNDGGAGGSGVSSSITGSAVLRGGGGGGPAYGGTAGAAGSGGGGVGGSNGVAGGAGGANTGGGGGGGGGASDHAGGAGGSGIVIISYEGSQAGSGGTITTNTSVTPNRTVHTFLLAQTGTSFTPTSAYNVEYLVIAGGGGGGGGLGGGGGAGGYRTATGFGVTAQAYTITVGAGGAGAVANASKGSDSVFSTITSEGGGLGTGEAGGNGGDGGSGGGTGQTNGSGGTASTYDTKPTNIQLGSRFEETDTRKMYHYKSSVTFEDDFSGINTWTPDGTDVAVNTSTDVIDWDSDQSSGGQDQLYKDLTTVSDTSWVVDFDITFTTVGASGSSAYGIYLLVVLDSITADANTVGHDALGIAYEVDNTPTNQASIEAFSCDNLNLYDSMEMNTPTGTISIFTETAQASETQYIRMIRDGTTFTVEIYSNSTRTTLVESEEVDANDGGTVSGLRYLKIMTSRDNTGDHEFVGTIDNVKFYNGVTSTDNVWSEEGT